MRQEAASVMVIIIEIEIKKHPIYFVIIKKQNFSLLFSLVIFLSALSVFFFYWDVFPFANYLQSTFCGFRPFPIAGRVGVQRHEGYVQGEAEPNLADTARIALRSAPLFCVVSGKRMRKRIRRE